MSSEEIEPLPFTLRGKNVKTVELPEENPAFFLGFSKKSKLYTIYKI